MVNTISTKGMEKVLQKELGTPSIYEASLNPKEKLPEDDVGVLHLGDKETYAIFFLNLIVFYFFLSGLWVTFSLIRWVIKLIF